MTGRPSITLTDAQRDEVETLAAVLTAEQIADFLGSRLIDPQSQHRTVAARATAERKVLAHLS